MTGKKSIVYIIGAGRSGTTLLDIALGNQPGIVSGGELNRFTFREGIPTEFEPESDRYKFWEKIKIDIKTKYDLGKYDRLQDEFEHHLGLVKRLLGLSNSKKYREYQHFLKDFYQRLFEAIAGDTVVDSSKHPGRAWTLSETLPYQISYIYIKRNPIGVVESFGKKDICHPPKPWLAANIYYFAINILCRIIIGKLKRKHKITTIRYEDIIESPEKTFTKIQDTLELDLSTVIDKVNHDKELEVGNLFEGNRIRIPEKLKLLREHRSFSKNFKNSFTRMLNGFLYS